MTTVAVGSDGDCKGKHTKQSQKIDWIPPPLPLPAPTHATDLGLPKQPLVGSRTFEQRNGPCDPYFSICLLEFSTDSNFLFRISVAAVAVAAMAAAVTEVASVYPTPYPSFVFFFSFLFFNIDE